MNFVDFQMWRAKSMKLILDKVSTNIISIITYSNNLIKCLGLATVEELVYFTVGTDIETSLCNNPGIDQVSH